MPRNFREGEMNTIPMPGPLLPGGESRGPSIDTQYLPGKIQVQTQVPGLQGGGMNNFGALLDALLGYKKAGQAQPGMRPGGKLRMGPAREGMRQPSRGGGGRGGGRQPIYTKMVGGPQMVPGRVLAQPWEQGASVSGYGPPGFDGIPQNATFAGGQGAELTAPGITRPSAAAQSKFLDPFPHGTGAAFAAAQMEEARARSNREIEEREERRRQGSKE